ncbi:hypothetical protein [Qipengyuania qiaonensis]|uniref:EscI/YscI/HrpB family type III secretion system inner rod protein n=1 Tax=Qipengyuania qiaonensis TaxID=2867240 RepID=A0ABS7J5Z7_9SPHN|nr:hypothetical protein [Qipengyuania qiaonensis]MBX7482753.1 hypothetical protein [Qipengyuania qiaonensis]
MADPLTAIAAASAAASGGGGAATARPIELGAPGGGAAGGLQPQPVAQARFDAALQAAGHAAPLTGTGEVSKVMNGLFDTLDSVDAQAKSVADYARSAEASDGQLTPGEIVNLTMRCQEFMFQCQLTSNIANRSADGVQQLFRQQG